MIWWILLVIFMLYMCYMAFVIKNEKNEYLKNAKILKLKDFTFTIPHWWGEIQTQKTDELVVFERLDTRYEWRGTFFWVEDTLVDQKNLNELLIDQINIRGIQFDQDTSIIHEKKNMNNLSYYRIEGTATGPEFDRMYYDAYVFKGKSGYLFLENKASVLNGLLEGPYFEEMAERIIFDSVPSECLV